MRARHARRWIAAGALAVCAGARTTDGDTDRFPQPDRIRYDTRALTLHERDTLIYCAAFDYTRVPAPLWRAHFARLRAAGFNAVESAVPWNAHEHNAPPTPGDYRHMNLTPLAEWLRMAHEEFGLHTLLRIGPYTGAGTEGGGLPSWLHTLAPEDPATPFLRSAHPLHLDWCRHWLTAVCRVLAPEQLTRKNAGRAGVILVQLEDHLDTLPDAHDRAALLRTLHEIVRENGIDVPVVTAASPNTLAAALHGAPGAFDLDPGSAPSGGPRAVILGPMRGDRPPPDPSAPAAQVHALAARVAEALRSGATILRVPSPGEREFPWSAVTAIGRFLADRNDRLPLPGWTEDDDDALTTPLTAATKQPVPERALLLEADQLFVRGESTDDAEFAPLPPPRADAGAPRFTLYRAELPAPADGAAPWTAVRVRGRARGEVLAQMNGVSLQRADDGSDNHTARFALPESLWNEPHPLLFLHDDPGDHDGAGLRRGPGLYALEAETADGHTHPLPLAGMAELTGARERWDAPRRPEPGRWTLQTLPRSGAEPDDEPPPMAAWFRIEFELPEAESAPACVAQIEARGAGWVYLNSRPLGRWNGRTKGGYLALPSCWLHTGAGRNNVLTLVLRPGEYGVGVDRVRLQAEPESE
jgi:hypothetical protein